MCASVAYHLTRRGITDVLLIERDAHIRAGRDPCLDLAPFSLDRFTAGPRPGERHFV